MAPKIIIVDDDRDTREMLQVALEVEGYEVSMAANGLRLISSLHVDQPDLILLDVMMSWIDGFELCRSIRANEEFSHVPVIFISGKKMPQDQKRGFEVGAVDLPVRSDSFQASPEDHRSGGSIANTK